MKLTDRITVIETKVKYIERMLYVITALILAQLGVNVIPGVI